MIFSFVDELRDPIHGFIKVSKYEMDIINSTPFQRLRNIKQLALTHLVYHGAEHTRFGHSIGVMELATRAFKSAVISRREFFEDDSKLEWYEQILRLIALTHDLGHAPFSHASESLFPNKKKHEYYTELIVKETSIGAIITEIGAEFVKKFGQDYDITPSLICDIYQGVGVGMQGEFIFLRSFMDSELDCDKMDYLLRDSFYCGVKYGQYDVDRLIKCLTVHINHGVPSLAISKGGVQAFEEFVLARYFMFVQVYFHRTRRFFDLALFFALRSILPGGVYPEKVHDYLLWDDCHVLEELKKATDNDYAMRILHRDVFYVAYDTKTHPESGDIKLFNLIRRELITELGVDVVLDDAASKLPHQIPRKSSIGDEGVIKIVNKSTGEVTTISDESSIISVLTDKINIKRIYVNNENRERAKEIVAVLVSETV